MDSPVVPPDPPDGVDRSQNECDDAGGGAVTSTARDPFSLAATVVCALASLVSVVGWLALLFRWQQVGRALAGISGGVPLLVAVVVFAPLAVGYARTIRPRVTVTERSISGVAGRQTVELADITRWEIRKNLLVLWPTPERLLRRGYLASVVHPGAPLFGTMWVALDPRQCDAIGRFLTTQVGPPGIARSR